MDDFVRDCYECTRANRSTTVVPVKPIVSLGVGERLVGDLTQMPWTDSETNAKYILLVVDHFSKYCWGCALESKSAPAVAQFFNDVLNEISNLRMASTSSTILAFDRHTLVHTDNGKEFVNSVLNEVTRNQGAKKIEGAPYHPQSQGIVERKNRTVKSKFMKLLQESENQTRWTEILPTVLENENNVRSEATNNTPSLLLRGFDKDTAEVDNQELLLCRVNALQRMLMKAQTLTSKSNVQATKFKVGDIVLVNTRNEREKRLKKTLTPTFSTPASIVEVLTANRYYITWLKDPPEPVLGKSGQQCKRPWPVKYLKRLPHPSAKPASNTMEPVQGTSHSFYGPPPPSPPASHRMEPVQGTSRSFYGPAPASHRTKPLQGTSLSKQHEGQQLWNNGSNGCYLNVLLALGTLLKSRTTKLTQINQNLTPIARTFFGTSESWTPGSAQIMVNSNHGVHAHRARCEKRDDLRALITRGWTGGVGRAGEHGNLWATWMTLAQRRTYPIEGYSVPPLQIPSAEQVMSTVNLLYMPINLTEQCSHCFSQKTVSVPFPELGKLPRSTSDMALSEAIQTMLDKDRGIRCKKKVNTQSPYTKGAFINQPCRGTYTTREREIFVSPFFGVPFETQPREKGFLLTNTKKRLPRLEHTVTINVGSTTHKYELIAIFHNPEGHFTVSLKDNKKHWWHYDDQLDDCCTTSIVEPSEFMAHDCAAFFQKITKKRCRSRTPDTPSGKSVKRPRTSPRRSPRTSPRSRTLDTPSGKSVKRPRKSPKSSYKPKK